VIRTRDVIFDEETLYNPADIDWSQLHESEKVDDIVEVIYPSGTLREMEEDTIIVDWQGAITSQKPIMPKAVQVQEQDQLPSPELTPSLESMPPIESTSSHQSTASLSPLPESDVQPQLVVLSSFHLEGGQPSRNGSDFSEANIIPGGRTRRSAYAMHSQLHAQTVTSFQPFYAAFSARRAIPKLKTHRDSLPTTPKNWKEMLAHPHAEEFKAAAQKEHDDLLRKKVFKYVNSGYSEQKPLPLMWVFTYKFDPDGFLIKHKARLCARGDLQETTDETYAATLAAQTFRFMMAIAAYFDLEVWQYDAVNAFANLTLDPPILCKCPDGFEGLGHAIWVLMALYGLKVSPIL
jgi:hypothetical protein